MKLVEPKLRLRWAEMEIRWDDRGQIILVVLQKENRKIPAFKLFAALVYSSTSTTSLISQSIHTNCHDKDKWYRKRCY